MALGPFFRHRSAPAERHEDLAGAGEKDLEQEERRLGTAALNGEVPPIWYRQRMAALAAAERLRTDQVGDAPSA